MPPAVAVISSAIGAIFSISSAATILAVINAVTVVVSTATSLLLSYGLSIAGSLLRPKPKIPKAADGKVGLRQATAGRISGYGRARIAGVYMCYEERGGASYDVLAFHDGRIDGFERYFLHDDEVTVASGVVQATTEGAYGGGAVRLRTTLGLPRETAFAETVAGIGDIWTANHRGDGVASLELVCRGVGQGDFSRIYPNGLPQPSAVARLQRVFDPRDPAQSYANPATWRWSDNPILALLHFLTDSNAGMGFDYARRIAPAIDSWKTAADVCDEPVPLAAGGAEKRYRCGGWFFHDTDPVEVIDMLLTTCDGWLAPRGDGSLLVRAGKFTEPTVVFETQHIVEFSTQRFVADEDAVNELIVGYTTPTNYSDVEAPAWIDQADKDARGKDRISSVEATWVQSGTQARRLAKRTVLRANAPCRGWIRTNLFGLTALGERYIRIRNPTITSLADITAEIVRIEFDLANMTVLIEYVQIGPEIDVWTPSQDEGPGEATVSVPGAQAPDGIIGASVAGFFEYVDPLSGALGVRIRYRFTPPARDDLGFLIQTNIVSNSLFVRERSRNDDFFARASIVDNVVQLDTRYLTVNQPYAARIATVAPGGTRGPFSADSLVTTNGLISHPPPPRLITVSPGAAGVVNVAWTNCPIGEVNGTQVFRAAGAAAEFASAVQIGADITGTFNQAQTVQHTGLVAGIYRYWLRHKSTSGLTTLDAAGPFSVTVT